jgi:hypothetical protein
VVDRGVEAVRRAVTTQVAIVAREARAAVQKAVAPRDEVAGAMAMVTKEQERAECNRSHQERRTSLETHLVRRRPLRRALWQWKKFRWATQ